MGSKKLLPENSVLKLISWENKPISTDIVLLLIRQNTFPHGWSKALSMPLTNHMELYLTIKLMLVVTGLLYGHQCLLHQCSKYMYSTCRPQKKLISITDCSRIEWVIGVILE